MRTLAIKTILVLSGWSLSTFCPVLAHVKWFLSRPESEILKQPKPTLFTQLSVENIIPAICALSLIFILYRLNLKYSDWLGSKRLMNWAAMHEPLINLFMALGLGASLISSGLTSTLFVPNFVICSHCPQWLPAAEIITGECLILGFLGRFSGLAILGLMYMAISKHGITECLDILPLGGLAFYFILSGRNRLSLDHLLGLDKISLPAFTTLGHYCVRATMGLGLIALSLSEKLLHPQLAMDLLQHAQALNPLLHFGVSNPMFVLVSGLAELLLGMSIFMGWFPRTAVLVLLGIFFGTTAIFGMEEFIGHAACYSSILSIALWGTALPMPSFARQVLSKFLSELNLAKLNLVQS
jgi:hypothetical protein